MPCLADRRDRQDSRSSLPAGLTGERTHSLTESVLDRQGLGRRAGVGRRRRRRRRHTSHACTLHALYTHIHTLFLCLICLPLHLFVLTMHFTALLTACPCPLLPALACHLLYCTLPHRSDFGRLGGLERRNSHLTCHLLSPLSSCYFYFCCLHTSFAPLLPLSALCLPHTFCLHFLCLLLPACLLLPSFLFSYHARPLALMQAGGLSLPHLFFLHSCLPLFPRLPSCCLILRDACLHTASLSFSAGKGGGRGGRRRRRKASCSLSAHTHTSFTTCLPLCTHCLPACTAVTWLVQCVPHLRHPHLTLPSACLFASLPCPQALLHSLPSLPGGGRALRATLPCPSPLPSPAVFPHRCPRLLLWVQAGRTLASFASVRICTPPVHTRIAVSLPPLSLLPASREGRKHCLPAHMHAQLPSSCLASLPPVPAPLPSSPLLTSTSSPQNFCRGRAARGGHGGWGGAGRRKEEEGGRRDRWGTHTHTLAHTAPPHVAWLSACTLPARAS